MRIVKVRKIGHSENTFLDVSKIVAISEPYKANRFSKIVSYYDIYFDNVIWNVETDSYDTVMRAWVNSDSYIPNDLKDYVFN